MESVGSSSGSANTAAAAMPSPSYSADNCKVFCSSIFKATNYEFDPSISEEERRFYLKAYPTVDVVRERKTHCTVCKIHIGTAPVQEHGIKMHPILRVTHCNKCHDFYNSGEFSKGEDGSELYCRWCGQGGEVYCCSSCPYVFCKSCIVKNLSRGVVSDIEQNENWNCFSCAPKILWPLRAQHWALMNYIEHQKKELYALNLSESELKMNLGKDRSKCCRLAKAKCGNMSDSMESLDSVASKRSQNSSFSTKKPVKHAATSPQLNTVAKRAKSNDEVVCTPDLLSMLEPDCQITVPPKPSRPIGTPSASTPKIMSIQQPQSCFNTMGSAAKNTAPPPLVLRNTAIKLRPAAPPPVVRRTIIGPRTPTPGGNGTPVYHTINGYRIDLNSAAQQETFRLPNGKLIQVKRQGPPPPPNTAPSVNNWQQMASPQSQRIIPQTIASRPVQITQHHYNISVQQQQVQHPQVVRYPNNMIGTTTIAPVAHNGTTIQVMNGQVNSGSHQQPPSGAQQSGSGSVRPVMLRHVFPDNPIGHARSGLQDQVFNAMEICTHLTNKVQTLTNSNAYKQARNYLEVKELYIHLSYLLTYAIGRFKSLQDKCLGDMRTLGFGNDADSLENGQLAADKQASDDEDNEIEIVEPKTDLITLDSDDDELTASSPNKSTQALAQIKTHSPFLGPKHSAEIKIKAGNSPVPVVQHKPTTSAPAQSAIPQVDESLDLMSMAQSFLASMLEVELHEGPINSPGSDSSGQKKQPRKKLTSKPNPTLLKQKALMERERLEEMKRNDQKLKMKCAVELKKAEEMFPYAKEMLEARAKELVEDKKMAEEHDDVTSTASSEDASKVNAENELINGTTEDNCESSKEDDTDSSKTITKEQENAKLSLKSPEKSPEKINLTGISENQDDDLNSCNGKIKEAENELNNSDSAATINEKHATNEKKLLTELDENSQNMEIDENSSHSSKNVSDEHMKVDPSPLDAAKTDETETEEKSKQTSDSETTKTEPDELEAAKLDPEAEALGSEEERTHNNSETDNKNSEQQLEKFEEHTALTLSPKEVELAIIKDKENLKNVDDPDSELPQKDDANDSASEQPTSEALLTTSSSNGNV